MTIGYRIQQLRKEIGMTQENLAGALNVSRQAVSKWESDQSLPDLDKIIMLSECLHTTTDYILKGTPITSSTEEALTHELSGRKQESIIYPKLAPTTILILSTAINLIGFLIFTIYYFDGASTLGALIGIILMILSSTFFGIQIHAVELPLKYKTKRTFGLINIWLLSFSPIIVIGSRWFSLLSYLISDKLIRLGFATHFLRSKVSYFIDGKTLIFPLLCYVTFCFMYSLLCFIYYRRKIKNLPIESTLL